MSKQILIEISSDEELNRIFTKAHYLESVDASLLENTTQFLINEKIDEKEAKKVSDALEGSREQIAKLEKYLNSLKSGGMDLTKIPTITKMVKDMSKALDKAQGDFAAVNFDSGSVSNFMGSKMTAPSITKAVIGIQTKANQFLTGFTDALQNIEKNLVPLAKDPNIKDEPLRNIAGQGGIPDEAKLEKGIKTAIERSLKPKGFLAKLKNFFSKTLPGAEGKILKSIPELDVDEASQELTDAILDTSLSVFDAPDIKDTKVPMKDLEDIVKDVVPTPDDSKNLKSQSQGDIISALLNVIKEKDPERYKALSSASKEDVEDALANNVEDIQQGEPLDKVADEAASEGLTGIKWSEITKKYVDAANDKESAQKVVDALKDDKDFQDAVSGKINLGEGLTVTRLTDILFEDVPFSSLEKAAEKGSDDQATQTQLARSLADTLNSMDVEVTGMPAKSEDAPDSEEESEARLDKELETLEPVDDKTAEKEQKAADKELKDAVEKEADQNQTPKQAALGALDDWTANLSPTSQQSLRASNRLEDLKDVIDIALDDAAKDVEAQVAAAIESWRDDHEETLVKSKRFAKKNFDELQKLIPRLVSSILKKSNESLFRLTKTNIQKIVFEFLDRKFYKDYEKILFEGEKSYSEESLIVRRLNRMAGLE